MISDEKRGTRPDTAAGGAQPPGGGGNPAWPWWRQWPPPRDRPRPLNRRNLLRGALIALPALLVVDGLLAAMAVYATGRLAIGLAVGVFMLAVTGVELAIVAWAIDLRQRQEARRED